MDELDAVFVRISEAKAVGGEILKLPVQKTVLNIIYENRDEKTGSNVVNPVNIVSSGSRTKEKTKPIAVTQPIGYATCRGRANVL
jgi:hypothetical protein